MKQGYVDKTRLNQIGKTLYEHLTASIEAPKNGSKRKWYRDIMKMTKQKLAAKGVNMTYADIQAVLWYNEKDITEQFGFTGKGSEKNDYAYAAKLIAQQMKESNE